MKLVPLGDRVVLKQLVAEETTKSGIVLPGQNKEKPQQAEVIAVGPGGVVDGKEVKMEVKVGDQVIYSKYAGTDVKLDDEEYIVVKQSDILAVIEAYQKPDRFSFFPADGTEQPFLVADGRITEEIPEQLSAGGLPLV